MKPDNTFYLPFAATFLTIILATLLATGTGHAADQERKKRLAKQSVDATLDGKPITLKAGNHEFPGIYTKPESCRRSHYPAWP